jgi:hypothetical protein
MDDDIPLAEAAVDCGDIFPSFLQSEFKSQKIADNMTL